MKKTLLKAMVAASITLSAGNAMAACVWVDALLPPYLNSIFSQADLKMDNNIKSNFATMDSELNKASQESVDKITAAVFVLSNQKALGTKQINTAIKNNTQVQASAMQSINQAKRNQQAIRDYGVQGVGHDICKVSKDREDIADATIATQKAIAGMVNEEITARAGKYANSKQALATRLALHDKYYCTVGQAAAGMCQGHGSRAGASLSASTLFVESDYLSAEYNDKSAFINNMIGLPDDPVPMNQTTTTSGQAYSDLKRRKDAIKSTAATSLKAIQAEWSAMPTNEPHEKNTVTPAADAAVKTEKEQLLKEAPETKGVVPPAPQTGKAGNTTTIGDMGGVKPKDDAPKPPPTGESNPAGTPTPPADGSPVTPPADTPAVTTEEKRAQSLMAQVKADVARYLGGGAEYESWSKTLVGQEEKGLLTEVLKVKALRLYLQTQEFKQLQRMEAMFAANVAATTESSGMSGRVEAQRQVAVRHAIRDNAIVRD